MLYSNARVHTKCRSFLFHQSHTTNSKINWLAVFVSAFCFSKITLLLEVVINGLSQSWVETHGPHSHQERSKARLPHLLPQPHQAAGHGDSLSLSRETIHVNFSERDLSVKLQWTQKLRDLGSITTYWYLYSSPLFHTPSGHLWKDSLPSGLVPPRCEIPSSPITLIGLDSTIKHFSPKDDRGFDNLVCYVSKSAETD